MAAGTLEDLRTAIRERLESISALAGVPVITEEQHDIEAVLHQSLASVGVCLTVGTAGATAINPNLPVPRCECTIIVEGVECVAINRGGDNAKPTAIELACLAARALHHHAWEPGNVITFKSIAYNPGPKYDAYQVSVQTSVLIDADIGE